MADFRKMAEAMVKRTNVDTDEQLAELKNQKDSITQMFNLQIAQLEMQKNEQKAVEDQMKYEDKRNKIKADLIKNVIQNGGGGNVAIGDDMIGELANIDPDAEGLPVIGQQA